MHPFEKAREYSRALNAVKLERAFAKPFIGSLEGHRDGVYCMAKNRKVLSQVASGSADGMVKVWNLSTRSESLSLDAHRGFVRGACFNPLNDQLITCGDDKTVKVWNGQELVTTIKGKNYFAAVDHHYSKHVMATSGVAVDIWDHQRSDPVTTYTWGADTINTVRFNQTEVSVLASCGTDRTVMLYDIRHQAPLAKLVMKMKANAVTWNPMEAFNFVVANEDGNAYMYDMRKMQSALNVYKDHTSAVIDVDFSPTGQEIVTGSYDKSLRIFEINKGHSRDIYHTSRMQRLFCTLYSMDGKYVLSGSDDSSIRLWKANASETLGPLANRQRDRIAYESKLKERYQHMPEVRKISKSRNVPKYIKTAQSLKKTILSAEAKRLDNRRRHSTPGSVKYKAERKQNVISIEK